MQRGQSSSGTGISAPSSNAAALAASAAASSPTAMPSLGTLVLKESYCKLGDPFNAGLSYELSPVAVEFLTTLFKRYDADGDGLLCVKAGAGTKGAEALTLAVGVIDAAPSATCSLLASTDLERMFLACPDIPFAVPSFTQFVTSIPPSIAVPSGGNYLSLDGWLASWALLLHGYASVPLPLTSAAAGGAASPASHSFAVPSLGSPVFVPSPDIFLRYQLYLCFPIEPAIPSARSGKGAHPRIQQCIHVTPRDSERDLADVAQQINERSAVGSPRPALTDVASSKPRSVVCAVIGSASCGKTAFIDCMLGNSTRIPQPVSSSTVAGLCIPQAASNASSAASASAAASVAPQVRTYATRMPLSHLPERSPAAAAAASPQSSGLGGIIETSLQHDTNRFLLLKEVPESAAAALLSSLSFTAASVDLVLLLYDGSSSASLEFARARLQQCAAKRIPVLVVQTKGDLANCSLAKNDVSVSSGRIVASFPRACVLTVDCSLVFMSML
jgi:hypothetical protein